MEFSDDHEVYFASRERNALLMKASPERPNSEPLATELPRVWHWTLWTIAAGGIYFAPADTPKSLCYFDFTTKQIREIFKRKRISKRGCPSRRTAAGSSIHKSMKRIATSCSSITFANVAHQQSGMWVVR
jgi:hypothetical protein